MQRFVTTALVVVFLALSTGAALAQPMAGSPTFATMDRQDGESKIGGSLGWSFFDDDVLAPGEDLTAIRFDVYGHYVGESGLGGYGVLPLSWVFADDDDESAIGNLEGGAVYVIRSGPNDFVLRGGLTLPTADDGTGAFANLLSTWPRLTDVAHAFPETFWLRLSASPILRAGQFVFRFDGGIDVALSSDGEEPDPFLRLNVGGGIDTGSFVLLGELVNLTTLGDDDDDVSGDDEDFIHTAAISARFRAGAVEPGIALGFPLDEDVRDFLDFFIIAGLQGSI
jgi:hypothetical protein